MKHALSSFVLSLAVVLPLLVACGGASEAEPASEGPAAAPAPADDTASVDEDLKSGKKKSCAAAGGSCVGLSPTSCQGGHFADATKVSCGKGIGTACCITCPTFPPLPPSFCPGGKIVPRQGANGCTAGYDCVQSPTSCPEIVQPPPTFCPGGKTTPVKNAKGCVVGFDCTPASNACVAAGGTCVGLSPSSCAGGTWADATTHSCGAGLGVGCCLP
jgi:hypothetical protein